jgi:putative membrane protein
MSDGGVPPAEPPSAMDGGAAMTAPATQQVVPVAAAAAAAAEPAKPKLTDAQIAKITDAANSTEIEQANLALQKSKNPDVKKFAEMMVKHHSEAKKEQKKLNLDMASSAVSDQLGGDATTTMASLKKATAADFDRAYIDAQVDGHRKVLNTLQNELLPDANNADLKAYLEKIRPTVEKHLKAAEALQLSFEKKATANADSKSTIKTPPSK